jgi:GTP cyclohydrolase II
MTAERFDRASCLLGTAYGPARMHVFSFGVHEEDNIICIQPDIESLPKTPTVRVQSACYTAEIFQSTDCDCHGQLHESLAKIHKDRGLLVYMLCDGRGAGLLTKVRGLALGDDMGLDTFDAYEHLGVEPDPRDYVRVSIVLQSMNINSIRLLTNNPRKIEALAASGIEVERVPIVIPATRHSRSYLETKRLKFGHLFDPNQDEN